MSQGKVVVAMSGGVDSSVAACLLREQGYEVMGLFMRTGAADHAPPTPEVEVCHGSVSRADTPANRTPSSQAGQTEPEVCHGSMSRAVQSVAAPRRQHQGCCSAVDAADARYVAGMMNIPFYALNFEDEFSHIVDYFAEEYHRGRTPNPCVVCNSKLKFGKIVEYADAVGADYIATGHYAQIDREHSRPILRRGLDADKDQSYVLFGLRRSILDRVMFPIGSLTKPEVRAHARRFNLPLSEKPDSVEICFVPDRDYARVVKERKPGAFQPGDVVDSEGAVLGQHNGIGHFTIGQRRGLGIAMGEPVYVTRLNVLDNTVTIGPREQLLHRSCLVRGTNYLAEAPAGPFRAHAQIRYHHQAAPAGIEPLDGSTARVTFDDPQSAITPGQACVFYDGDSVIGGGWIDQVDDSA